VYLEVVLPHVRELHLSTPQLTGQEHGVVKVGQVEQLTVWVVGPELHAQREPAANQLPNI